MNDTELQKHVEEIEQQVTLIAKKLPSGFKVFWNGILKGFGSIVGVVLAIIVIGFVLNVLGVIPAFKGEVETWKQILEQNKGIKSSFK